MATTFYAFPGQPDRATDSNGAPVPGAKRYFFSAGTTTPLTVYSNIALSSAHASPQIADANGYFAPAYVSGPDEVKITVYDASDNLLYEIDYVTGQPVGGLDAASVPFTPTSRINADDAQEAIEDVDRLVEYLEAGFDLIVTTGSANAYLLNTAIGTYTAYATGDTFLARVSFANTGACTINVDSVGAKSVKFYTAGSKTDPASGEIQIGHILRLVYDGTDFVVTDHWRPMATQAEAEAGTAQGVLMDPLRTKQAITAQAMRFGEGTETSTTSVTSHDHTGIPANAIRVDVHIEALSFDTADVPKLQIGDSGGIETSGYAGLVQEPGVGGTSFTTGFTLARNGATGASYYTQVRLVRMTESSNKWSCSFVVGRTDTAVAYYGSGTKSLSGELTQIRITSNGGTAVVDAGNTNITYEVQP